MHGKHGHIRPLRDGRGQADRRKMRAVRGVHQQAPAKGAAQSGQFGERVTHDVLGQRGDQHRLNVRMVDERALDRLFGQLAGYRERLDQWR